MKTVTSTEFRKYASTFFKDVEKGEIFCVVRNGKPIAEITPIYKQSKEPSWKKPGLRLSIKGLNLSKAIIEERKL